MDSHARTSILDFDSLSLLNYMYLRSQYIDDGLNFNVNFDVLNIQMLNLKSRLSNLSLTVIVDILIV